MDNLEYTIPRRGLWCYTFGGVCNAVILCVACNLFFFRNLTNNLKISVMWKLRKNFISFAIPWSSICSLFSYFSFFIMQSKYRKELEFLKLIESRCIVRFNAQVPY